MWHDILTDVIGGLVLTGITSLFLFGRRFLDLPRQSLVITAALFRVLRSNKSQGIALEKIAGALKTGCKNGECDEAIKAVEIDQKKTDEFLQRAAFANPKSLSELLKEDE